ncbi:MAG: type VI secretion lipoprotein TssJ [Planctomycetes bacterium]|nr:type VI secretion lipoprotein TssJ [Planctomycetota bacterium]
MEVRRNRRGPWRRGAALALALVAAACSTQNVTLKATVGENLNPNLAGGTGMLDVYAFFLKKTDAFLAKDKLRSDFLVDSVRNDKKAPAWLDPDTVAVELMQIAPAQPDAWPVVEQRVEVPVGSTHVGFVAVFQTHRDNDAEEQWRLLVPVSGGAAAFRVAGRKLELPAAPPPKPKEAPRDRSNNG